MDGDFYEEYIIDGDKGPVVVNIGVDGNAIFVGKGSIQHGNYIFEDRIAGVGLIDQLMALVKRWYDRYVKRNAIDKRMYGES